MKLLHLKRKCIRHMASVRITITGREVPTPLSNKWEYHIIIDQWLLVVTGLGMSRDHQRCSSKLKVHLVICLRRILRHTVLNSCCSYQTNNIYRRKKSRTLGIKWRGFRRYLRSIKRKLLEAQVLRKYSLQGLYQVKVHWLTSETPVKNLI